MSRVIGIVVHNWPLKVGAIVLASLLYGGLVLSQTTKELPGSVPIETVNQSPDLIVLSDLGTVTRIRWVAPNDLGLRVDSAGFRATVDLAGVDPAGGPVTRTVRVTAVDPRVQVIDYEPRRILVTLDRVTSRTVPVKAVLGAIPPGFDVGDPVVDVQVATVSGPQTVVERVVDVEARVPIDASGIDVNRMVDLLPVDEAGEVLFPVDVDPVSVRVRVPVFTDRQTRSLPVNPIVIGTPAAGFEVASITVNPLIVSVEGDANDLAGLDRADTEPVQVTGASSRVSQDVGLALPDGVQPLGVTSVHITVQLRAVTASRSFEAGLILVGARADRIYGLSTDRVIVTLAGSVADLDRLAGTGISLTVDVSGLDVGTHTVPVSANLTTGLTLVDASPNPIQVTISAPASPPTATPGATPAPSPSS